MSQVETGPHRAPGKRASQEWSQPLGMGEVCAGRLRVSAMHRHTGIDGVGQSTRKLLPDSAGVDLRPGFGGEPRCGIPVAAVDRDHGAIDEGGGGGSLGNPSLPRGTHGRFEGGVRLMGPGRRQLGDAETKQRDWSPLVILCKGRDGSLGI